MTKRKPDDTVNLRLRLPEALRQKLETEANAAERSLNSEILWRLGRTFSEEWRDFIAWVEEKEKEAEELRAQVAQSPEFQKIVRDIIAERRERREREER
jgi:hypothetical protein